MAITDIVVIILSIYFIARGAARGFMRSLSGPLSIILGSILSVLYYQSTKDLIASLLIGLISPLILNFILIFLIKKLGEATGTDIKQSYISRLGGAFLTILWGGTFIVFSLMLLAVLPPRGNTLTAIHNDVKRSISASLINPLLDNILGPSKQIVTANDTNTISNNDAKTLAEDPRFQEVIKDPEVQKEIDARDFVKLMSNPKMITLVQQIMNDPATLKKVFALYRNQPQTPKNP